MLTLVGLGNPGAGYRNTRHNVGFMLVDGIVEKKLISGVEIHRGKKKGLRRLINSRSVYSKSSGPYVSAEGELMGTDFQLVKPTTFMNESGKALAYLARHGKIKDSSELLVIVDDVNLDLGRIRLRERGSAGGQNGLKSIISLLGTDDFPRLRIGIGPRPGGEDLKHYVLSSFHPREKAVLGDAMINAAAVVEGWLDGGIESAKIAFSRLSQ